MRRSMLYLALALLTAGLAVQSARQALRSATAQESSQTQSASRPPDRFAVPDSKEVSTLVDFVNALRAARPDQGPAVEDYERKAPPAIRQACQRILELDQDEASANRRFALRELLLFHLADLNEAEGGTEDERQRFVDEVRQFFGNSVLDPADTELATTLATTFEEFAPAGEARKLYLSLGEVLINSPVARIARRGEYLLGAARRLGLIGQPFELTGQTVDEQPFDLASLKGNVVLVQFWATWCRHCLQEQPELKRLHGTYHERGFEIVGISVDDDRDDLEEFLKAHPVAWPTLHDPDLGSEHPAAIRYGITAYPTAFLLDREGRVVAIDPRGQTLERRLAELCGGETPAAGPYPVFNIADVIEAMTIAGAKFHKAGKTVGDAQLRRGLHRRKVELELPEPASRALSDRELYRRACESVFIVCSLYKLPDSDEWQTSLATAFAVTPDGVLSTSCHVFDNEDTADAVVAMDVHGKVYPVKELLAANPRADTCLFRIEATGLTPLPLADDAPPGTPVRILSHPGDSFYYMSSGLVANYERDHDGLVWLNTTADFGQGSSGGPVLDEFCNVIGQVSRTYTLYAGGLTRRGRPLRTADPPTQKRDRDEPPETEADIADPQMVFKSCVTMTTLRSLIIDRGK